MKTGQFLINPASAIVLVASLAFPLHALAQSDFSSFGGRPSKPVCVYKGVMSDAEIEVCTGYPVHYNYAVYSGRSVAVASSGPAVRQVIYLERAPRPRAPRLARG